MTGQTISGFVSNSLGPGWIPNRSSAASMTDVLALPGSPSDSSGTIAPPTSELLAASGAATPSMAPLPNRSGRRDMFFCSVYDTNDAMVEPPPGTDPTRNPVIDPCAMAPRQSLRSCHVGNRFLMPFG